MGIKGIVLGLLLTWLSWSLFAQPVNPANMLVTEALRLESIPQEMAAFQKFQEALSLQPENLMALCKSSELCSRIGRRQPTKKQRDQYYLNAKQFATKALQLYPNDSEANVVMAIALGRWSMSRSGKEKIQAAKDIKKYVEAAIRSNPRNFKAWHVLGRWHYEIAGLSFIERSAVKIMYGGLPDASLREAIACFEIANNIEANFMLNQFELARAYHKNDEDAKARASLQKVLSLSIQTEDDASIKADAQKLLKEWD